MIDNNYTALLHIDTNNTSPKLLIIIHDEQNEPDSWLHKLNNAPRCTIFMLKNTLNDTKSAITPDLKSMLPAAALAMKNALLAAAVMPSMRAKHLRSITKHAEKIAAEITEMLRYSDMAEPVPLCIAIQDAPPLQEPQITLCFRRPGMLLSTTLADNLAALKNIIQNPLDHQKGYINSLKENRTLRRILGLSRLSTQDTKEDCNMKTYLYTKYKIDPSLLHNITVLQDLRMLFADITEHCILAVSLAEKNAVLNYISYASKHLMQITSSLKKRQEAIEQDLLKLNQATVRPASQHHADLCIDTVDTMQKLKKELKAIEKSLEAVHALPHGTMSMLLVTWEMAKLLGYNKPVLQECLPAPAGALLMLQAQKEIADFLANIEELFISNYRSNNTIILSNAQGLPASDKTHNTACKQNPQIQLADTISEFMHKLDDDLKKAKEEMEQLKKAREKAQHFAAQFLAIGKINVAEWAKEAPQLNMQNSMQNSQKIMQDGTANKTEQYLANSARHEYCKVAKQEMQSQKRYYQLQMCHETFALALEQLRKQASLEDARFMPIPPITEDQTKLILEWLAVLDTTSKQLLEELLKTDELKKFTLKQLSVELNAAAQSIQETKLPAQGMKSKSKLHEQLCSMKIAAASKQNPSAKSPLEDQKAKQYCVPTATLHKSPTNSDSSCSANTNSTEYLPDRAITSYLTVPTQEETTIMSMPYQAITIPKHSSAGNAFAGKIRSCWHELQKKLSSPLTSVSRATTESLTDSAKCTHKDKQMPQTRLYSINTGSASEGCQQTHTVQLPEISF